MKKIFSKKIITLSLILFFVFWSYTIFQYGPTEIVEMIGVNNAYIALAIMAFLGGSSILFPFPYYLFTISFAAAGLNPFLLGCAAGIGTLLGDSITYYITKKSRPIFSMKWLEKLEKAFLWVINKHPATFPVLAFFYSALTPLPDDILIIPAGLTKYPFIKLSFGLLPGKILFNTLLAFGIIF